MRINIKKEMSSEPSKQPTVTSNVNPTTPSILPDGDVPITSSSTANTTMDMDTDEQVIVALGYKQEFKREFSLWTTFCVSFAVLGLLPSFASTLSYGMLPLPASFCPGGYVCVAVLVSGVDG